jgi:hypothetical protein
MILADVTGNCGDIQYTPAAHPVKTLLRDNECMVHCEFLRTWRFPSSTSDRMCRRVSCVLEQGRYHSWLEIHAVAVMISQSVSQPLRRHEWETIIVTNALFISEWVASLNHSCLDRLSYILHLLINKHVLWGLQQCLTEVVAVQDVTACIFFSELRAYILSNLKLVTG